jgi:hypothetical protein
MMVMKGFSVMGYLLKAGDWVPALGGEVERGYLLKAGDWVPA